MQTLTKTTTSENNQKTSYTAEEYLILEEKAEFKSEYRNGEIIKMAGGTTNHNRITGNIYAYLNFFLRKKQYEVFISDVKLSIPQYNIYTYPDVMVVSDKPIYEGKGSTIITNPLLIIEVLSSSTQGYDRGKKFQYYRSIPNLQEYILISQSEYFIEQFTKNNEGKWVFTEYNNEQDNLQLESLSWEISLIDIYEKVDFNIEETEDKNFD